VVASDATDGVKNGIIDDPTRCKFDFKALQCKGEDATSCLTAPQVEAAKKITAPAINPRTGEQVYPGLSLGAELGWATQTGGPEPNANSVDQFKYVVFKDPNWDWRTFNIVTDVALVVKIDNGTFNGINLECSALSTQSR